ncbi:hypothetical protein [Actinomyces gaoshouyii]|uniref:hypothetical protein n=1 Tax=Actinomyces gaoshouyii TaxID=1960083 RepID=UPI0026A6EB9D
MVARAIDDLDVYLERQAGQLRQASRALRGAGLNHRQIAVIDSFLRDSTGSVSVEAHRTTHGAIPQTARTDLRDLQARGLLISARQGRRMVWFPVDDLARRVRA